MINLVKHPRGRKHVTLRNIIRTDQKSRIWCLQANTQCIKCVHLFIDAILSCASLGISYSTFLVRKLNRDDLQITRTAKIMCQKRNAIKSRVQSCRILRRKCFHFYGHGIFIWFRHDSQNVNLDIIPWAFGVSLVSSRSTSSINSI